MRILKFQNETTVILKIPTKIKSITIQKFDGKNWEDNIDQIREINDK